MGIYGAESKTDDAILDQALEINTYRGRHYVDILKGNKKLTEMVKKVDLQFPLAKTQESDYRYSNEKYRLTIE